MGNFAVYTFYAGVILLALYIIYKWLLSTENQPRFNRVVLLSIYATAFVALPLISLVSSLPLTSGEAGAITIDPGTIAMLADGDAAATHAAWPRIVLRIYLAGVCATLLWTAFTALRLGRLIAHGEHIRHGAYTLVLLDRDDIAPFSWGSYVVLSRNEAADSTSMILTHECAHIAARHFVDLLIAQAVCNVLWYNPASWLMLRELKAVHEYEADERVLRSGVNARNYQLLLIKKAVGV